MGYWVKVAGTGEEPFTEARRRARMERFERDGRLPSLFPRRPRIARGDRLVVYASGSAAEYGEGRIFAVEEVLSHEPEPSGRERWTWMVETRILLVAPSLAAAPAIREIGVSPKSLRQHSHIRLDTEKGYRAEELIRLASGV